MSATGSGETVSRRLLTPEEAARALGIGRTLVFELLGSGRLRSVRIGACRRVPVGALDEFVAGLLDTAVGAGGS